MLLISREKEGERERSTMGIAIMLLDHAMRPPSSNTHRTLHAIHTAHPSISRQIPPAD